jgi:hypothetical protein
MIAATHIPEIHAAAAAHAADVAAGLTPSGEHDRPLSRDRAPRPEPREAPSRLPLIAGAVSIGVLLGISAAAAIWYALKDDVLAPAPARIATPPVTPAAQPAREPEEATPPVSQEPTPEAPQTGPEQTPPPPATEPPPQETSPPQPPQQKPPDLKKLP